MSVLDWDWENEEKKLDGEDSRGLGDCAGGAGDRETGGRVRVGEVMRTGETAGGERRSGRDEKYSSRREKKAS